MIQVEILINSSPARLQEEVNVWIKQHSFSLVQTVNYSVDGGWHYAMIVYKVLI